MNGSICRNEHDDHAVGKRFRAITVFYLDIPRNGKRKRCVSFIVRTRYRESYTDPKLIELGVVYEYEIEIGVTGNVFLKGHSIRLEISSSNFPRFDRNPNTGHTFGQDTDMRPANQMVYHSQEYPSHIVLPAIPGI